MIINVNVLSYCRKKEVIMSINIVYTYSIEISNFSNEKVDNNVPPSQMYL